MMKTTIFLNGRTAYRREYDFITRCKKSEVATLIENRTSFDVIVCKEQVKKKNMIKFSSVLVFIWKILKIMIPLIISCIMNMFKNYWTAKNKLSFLF